MTQVLTKDNYFDLTSNTPDGSVDFDLLSFKFAGFSRWLQKNGSYRVHTVTQIDQGILDIISYRYYKTEDYWWIIAVANNLLDPINDVTIGRTLLIPTKESVSSYIASLTDTSSSTVIEL